MSHGLLPTTESTEEHTTMENTSHSDDEDAATDVNEHMPNEIPNQSRSSSTYEDFKLNLVDYEDLSHTIDNDLTEPVQRRQRLHQGPQPGPPLTPWHPRHQQSPEDGSRVLKPGPALTPWNQEAGRLDGEPEGFPG